MCPYLLEPVAHMHDPHQQPDSLTILLQLQNLTTQVNHLPFLPIILLLQKAFFLSQKNGLTVKGVYMHELIMIT